MVDQSLFPDSDDLDPDRLKPLRRESGVRNARAKPLTEHDDVDDAAAAEAAATSPSS